MKSRKQYSQEQHENFWVIAVEGRAKGKSWREMADEAVAHGYRGSTLGFEALIRYAAKQHGLTKPPPLIQADAPTPSAEPKPKAATAKVRVKHRAKPKAEREEPVAEPVAEPGADRMFGELHAEIEAIVARRIAERLSPVIELLDKAVEELQTSDT